MGIDPGWERGSPRRLGEGYTAPPCSLPSGARRWVRRPSPFTPYPAEAWFDSRQGGRVQYQCQWKRSSPNEGPATVSTSTSVMQLAVSPVPELTTARCGNNPVRNRGSIPRLASAPFWGRSTFRQARLMARRGPLSLTFPPTASRVEVQKLIEVAQIEHQP